MLTRGHHNSTCRTRAQYRHSNNQEHKSKYNENQRSLSGGFTPQPFDFVQYACGGPGCGPGDGVACVVVGPIEVGSYYDSGPGFPTRSGIPHPGWFAAHPGGGRVEVLRSLLPRRSCPHHNGMPRVAHVAHYHIVHPPSELVFGPPCLTLHIYEAIVAWPRRVA